MHSRPYLLIIVLIISCAKTSQNTNQDIGRTVYVAGDNGTNPVLWKNGTADILASSEGSARQVVLSGNDVYVAGISEENTNHVPAAAFGQYVYWKNGVPNNIGAPQFIGSPGSIAVAGNNVYYSGSAFWKNGVPVTLGGRASGYLTAVFAAGNDIYVTGLDSAGDAVYWKNGVLHVVAQHSPGTDPFAACLYVSVNDVYIGGTNVAGMAVYWKNGVVDTLQPAIGDERVSVNSIFVSGNDVYSAGALLTNGGNVEPVYWKNGIEYDLPSNGAVYGSANAIFVDGSDVYVAGQTAGAVYWKNGVETTLSSTGSANSIYVQ
jgi:hypothetical protein